MNDFLRLNKGFYWECVNWPKQFVDLVYQRGIMWSMNHFISRTKLNLLSEETLLSAELKPDSDAVYPEVLWFFWIEIYVEDDCCSKSAFYGMEAVVVHKAPARTDSYWPAAALGKNMRLWPRWQIRLIYWHRAPVPERSIDSAAFDEAVC